MTPKKKRKDQKQPASPEAQDQKLSPSTSASILALYEIPSASASSSKPASKPATSSDFIQYTKGTQFVRKYADGSMVEATLGAGPNGYALAHFEGDDANTYIQTEIPNLFLTIGPMKKKPAAAKAKAAGKKRPAPKDTEAADLEEESEEEAKAEEDEECEEEKPKLPVMAHRKANYVFYSKTWGECKAEFYTDKSYMRYKDEGGKLRLIMCTQGAGHQERLDKLVPHAMKGRMDKEKLAKIRDSL